MLENNKPDDIKRAITSLSEAFQRKEAKEFPVLAKEHFSEDDIARATKLVEQHDPEAFSRNFRHADDVIEGLLMLAGVDDRKSRFVFREYTFLERHVTNVITQYEGLACSVDKSRTIMRSYVNSLFSGTAIVFDFEQEYTFHLPKVVLNEHLLIHNFIDGLYAFFYGSTDKYLASMMEIASSATEEKIDSCQSSIQ